MVSMPLYCGEAAITSSLASDGIAVAARSVWVSDISKPLYGRPRYSWR